MQQRIAAFIDAPNKHAFNNLALEAFRFQIDRIEPYRRLCEGRNITADIEMFFDLLKALYSDVATKGCRS